MTGPRTPSSKHCAGSRQPLRAVQQNRSLLTPACMSCADTVWHTSILTHELAVGWQGRGSVTGMWIRLAADSRACICCAWSSRPDVWHMFSGCQARHLGLAAVPTRHCDNVPNPLVRIWVALWRPQVALIVCVVWCCTACDKAVQKGMGLLTRIRSNPISQPPQPLTA